MCSHPVRGPLARREYFRSHLSLSFSLLVTGRSAPLPLSSSLSLRALSRPASRPVAHKKCTRPPHLLSRLILASFLSKCPSSVYVKINFHSTCYSTSVCVEFHFLLFLWSVFFCCAYSIIHDIVALHIRFLLSLLSFSPSICLSLCGVSSSQITCK